jgi:hypothetical protein
MSGEVAGNPAHCRLNPAPVVGVPLRNMEFPPVSATSA